MTVWVYPHFSTTFTWGNHFCVFLFVSLGHETLPNESIFNPIALRKAKIVYNSGLSECNRVKGMNLLPKEQIVFFKKLTNIINVDKN